MAQAEIFGPVLVAMSFRTPVEAVQFAQQHRVWPGVVHLERVHQSGAGRCAANQGRGGVGVDKGQTL